MLTFNLKRIFAARGVQRPFTYMVRRGFSDNFSSGIMNGRKHQMNLREVERLCELLKCTPNDLLEWKPSAEQAAEEDHPLKPLLRTNTVEGLTQLLNSASLDKLTRIEALIKRELAE
ncbi:helix-turn-helix domain-containing protein [Acetobacteroides hydrogenigenes]|uniref:DNA-binding Xre family transcriptional regulator n=1 Tax=Acetobacteroides hydrogenigenes TaxID=979970 RepID=A0A4R2EPP7_9BACT|nr:helix-turn-helix transcriptional regulator [Acetobacteroides hydrogenigenes]TCN66389.1 DNA-binding Xre family transcriptional regulator [Acetobacteroides hydrogenigenes]